MNDYEKEMARIRVFHGEERLKQLDSSIKFFEFDDGIYFNHAYMPIDKLDGPFQWYSDAYEAAYLDLICHKFGF